MSEGPLPRNGAFDNIVEPRTLPTCGVVPYLGWFMTTARASHWTDTLNVINSVVSLTTWICIGERACVQMTTCDHPDASLVADIGHDGECSRASPRRVETRLKPLFRSLLDRRLPS